MRASRTHLGQEEMHLLFYIGARISRQAGAAFPHAAELSNSGLIPVGLTGGWGLSTFSCARNTCELVDMELTAVIHMLISTLVLFDLVQSLLPQLALSALAHRHLSYHFSRNAAAFCCNTTSQLAR